MNKLILSAAVFAAFATSASAQETAATSPFTGNLSLTSDYRFRGITQTFKGPAIQGGFDYASPSGFYIGNWNSNVSSNQYTNGSGLEMDLYGGYRFTPIKDLTFDVGGYYYYYPNASIGSTGTKYNNGEVYLGGTYQWFTAKYNYGVTDFFGLNNNTSANGYAFNPITPNGNSRGSGYLDLSGNFTVADKTTLTVHAGHQTVHDYSMLNYTDYKVGIARDFGFATIGLAVTTTDADKAFYSVSNATNTKATGTTAAVLSLSKTF